MLPKEIEQKSAKQSKIDNILLVNWLRVVTFVAAQPTPPNQSKHRIVLVNCISVQLLNCT